MRKEQFMEEETNNKFSKKNKYDAKTKKQNFLVPRTKRKDGYYRTVMAVQSRSASSFSTAPSSSSHRDSSSPSFLDETDSNTQSTRLRRLKDRMWVRETLEDLTSAEFASSLDSSNTTIPSQGKSKRSSKKRAVDYEKLLSSLDCRIEEMCVLTSRKDVIKFDKKSRNEKQRRFYPLLDVNHPGDGGSFWFLNGGGGASVSVAVSGVDAGDENGGDENGGDENEKCYVLRDGFGMGHVIYDEGQREALLLRILASRRELLGVIYRQQTELESSSDQSTPTSTSTKAAAAIAAAAEELDVIIREQLQNAIGFDPVVPDSAAALYVRDDGTVDWDGALQDRAALRKFGISVWARINGRDPETIDMDSMEDGNGGLGGDHVMEPVMAKIVETDAIREKRERLEFLQEEFRVMEAEHTALLNSAVKPGSAVANVNLASLNAALRAKIRASSNLLESKRSQISFQTLNFELERIYTYLDNELGGSPTGGVAKGYIPLQDRLNVAEFGLLESQIASLNRQQLMDEESVDSDVVAVILDQIVDFKRRLGIDYYVQGFTFDREAIKMWLSVLWVKTKGGLAFYVKGCELFWNDILYGLRLVGRAGRGYTLQPREVRTLRRTAKDVITFVPVVIILLIPLSPVGHVFVFGAIQRFFPGFFPSCFTESRQNLLKLYESAEYSEVVINETFNKKLIRIGEAIAYLVLSFAREVLGLGVEQEVPEKDDKKSNE